MPLTCFLLLPCVSFPQPALVKDINKVPLSAISPGSITTFNGIMYFSAESSAYGRELWRSDGTDAGTYILKDISAGKNSSSPSRFIVANNTLYFVANEVHKEDYINYEFEHHYELWKTDGTTQGTLQVGYFPMQSPQTNLYEAYPKLQLAATNNALYFTVNNAPTGYELWKTQGATTGKVADVSGDPYDPFHDAYQLSAAGNYAYFTASSNTSNFVLWRTDGTTSGTIVVKESNTIYGISSLTAIGDILYFAFQHETGNELWKSNGTPAGTQVVKTINFGLGGLFNANGLLYFTSGTYPNTQLWKSNGTTQGTTLLKDGLPDITIQTAIGTTIYFISSFQLWKSDGTTTGTVMLKSFEQDSSVSIQTKALNSTLYVGVYVQNSPVFALWKSDGTPQGTTLVQEFSPLEHTTYFPSLATLQGNVYLVFGGSLWKITGNPATAVRIYPERLQANEGSNPSSLLHVNGQVYFITGDGNSGFELWKTGGLEANTVLVKRNGGSGPIQRANLLASANTTVFFQVASYTAGNQLVNIQLWKSDGTAASTVLIKTLDTGIIGEALYWNGYLYFFTGKQLWKSNGTAQGTTLVKNINTEFLGLLTVWNNTLYFKDQSSIWKSDGSTAGTVVVKNIGGYGIGNFTPGNGLLYFTHSSGLWKTNGTAAGTLQISSQGSSISSMVFFNGALFFGTNAYLYKSDGTTAGTGVIKTIVKYDENYVENLTVAGNSLYFTYMSIHPDLYTYDELWKSDGTPAGTQVVKGIKAQNLKSLNGTLVFQAPRILNGKSENQLWRSNGNAENTNQVAELQVQLQYSAAAANTIYFSGNDGLRGYELWKYDVEACQQTPVTNLLVEGSTICMGENGKITIKGSQTGITYQAYFNNGSPVGEAKMGGGDITFTVPAASLAAGNNQFTLKAGGCTLVTLSGTATISVTSTCTPVCSAAGSILREVWQNITGALISDIPLNTAPHSTSQLTSFETITNTGNNYGQRIRGYLCVPQNGTYTFYIAGDDRCELWLSSDEDPTKKTKIASVPYFTAGREWAKYASQKSASINLVAGKKYYIEALHKEGSYADHLAVGWQTPASASISVIPGSVLSPFLIQNTGKITREYWANVTGALVSEIPVNTTPTTSNEITSFETVSNQGNNYGQRIRGYIHPQVSGSYRFYIAGDDRCELWLSSDEDPTKKTKIASVPYFTGVREWNKYPSQQSALVNLVAGRKYYIEALHKEGLYGDNLAVGWMIPGQTTVAVIAGSYLSPFLSSPTASIARVGVEESTANQVSIYPNPFEDKLTIATSQTSKLYISIVDILGRTVYQSTTQAGTELNLAHLEAGVYVVKLSSDDSSTQVLRVVKK